MKVSRELAVMAAFLLAAPAALAAVYSTPVRNVENPDRTPYEEYGSANIQPSFVNTFIFFPTPAGTRVVVEQMTVTCTTQSSSDLFTQALLNVTKQTGPSSTSSFPVAALPMRWAGPAFGGGYLWQGSMLVRAYSDPIPSQPDGGMGIAFNIFHTDTSVEPYCFGSLSGHLFTP